MTEILFEDEFAGLLEKHRRTCVGTDAALDRLLAACAAKSMQLHQRLEELEHAVDGDGVVVPSTAGSVDFFDLLSVCEMTQADVARKQRQLHVALNRFGKSVDSVMYPDLLKGRQDPVRLIQVLLLSAVAEYLCMRGDTDVLRKLQEEMGESLIFHTQLVYDELEQITSAIDCNGNLNPALEWAERESKELEFAIHCYRFGSLVECAVDTGDPGLALAYARAHFSECGSDRLPQVRGLMWKLLHCKLEAEDAAHLLARQSRAKEDLWKIRALAVSEFRRINRIPEEPPLLVAANVGALVLPARIKLASLMEVSQWDKNVPPPVTVVVPSKYKYHSVVVCPVSREQATPANPAVALPCGHLLCRNSLRSVTRLGGRRIKCPYCPKEAAPTDTTEVKF